MISALLAEGLAELGLPSEGELHNHLASYAQAIEEWNPAYGLVGATGDELIIKHILDSLAPLSIIDRFASARRRSSLADLGTGAGLPGIPLALARGAFDVALSDRMTRRITFLEAMKSLLGLGNVQIIETQVEHARGAWDLVTFRAFRPFERKLFKRVFALCAPGGYVIAYKGKMERAKAELAEIEGLYSSVEFHPVKVPFLEDERCVVLLSPALKTKT